jgi:hypothetical protein
MTKIEQLQAKKLKLERDIADAEYDALVQSLLPQVEEDRARQIASWTAERDALQSVADERALLETGLSNVDAAIDQALDAFNANQRLLRIAISMGTAAEVLDHQSKSTIGTSTLHELRERRAELEASLDTMATDEDDPTPAELDAQIAALAARDTLEMAEERADAEIEAEERSEAALANFAAMAMSARLLAPTAEDERRRRAIEDAQHKHDAAVQATPYRGW